MFSNCPKILNANGALVVKNFQFFQAVHRIVNQTIGTNKFGIDHIRALLFAQAAKWGIADIFHRSQQQGKIAQFYRTNFDHKPLLLDLIFYFRPQR
jgi:hypothetical protein